MKVSILSLVSILASIASAAPAGEPADVVLQTRADRGSYTVSGLGSRKQAVLNAGGNTLDLAIAMLETENMQANYAYGLDHYSSQKYFVYS